MRIVSLVALLLFALSGCAGGVTPIPQPESAAARLYAKKCSTCHSLPHPKRHNYAQWRGVLGAMDERAVERSIEPLTGSERAGILKYLKEHSR